MSLPVGAYAPDFALSNQFGQIVRLSDSRQRRGLFVVFVPLAFSPVCSAEVSELNERRDVFARADIEIVVVSVDSKATLRAWGEAGEIQLPLLADFWPHGEVSDAFGVFLNDKGFAGRSSFLLDSSGIIRSVVTSSVDVPRNFVEYERAILALDTDRG